MADRPRALEQLDRFSAAATLAHEHAANLHRRLAALDLADAEARELVAESAELLLGRMHELTRELHALRREWVEQELLDSARAERTASTLDAKFAQIEPELVAIRSRQDQIVKALRQRVDRMR